MLDRLRPVMTRPTALLLSAVIPAAFVLTACGGEDEQLKGFDAVEISGEVGSTPELDWKGKLAPGKAQAKVVTEGDGPAIAEDDVVQLDFTLANGYTHKVSYDTYDEFTVASLLKVGEEKEPASLADLLTQAVAKEIKPGQTIGSRIAVSVGSEQLLGNFLGIQQVAQFMASLDIGNEDGLLFVADLTSLAGPDGTEKKAPAGAPEVVEEDGVPVRLDFKGADAPSGKLEVTTLVQGDGPKVESGQKILASYLGQVPKGKAPFDESYSAGGGLEAVLGGEMASVVKGWSRGLVGLPVGSRVLLEIPPKLGYGKEAQKDEAGKVTIPANSTLYFIVDILDVADVKPAPAPAAPVDPSQQPSQEPSE